MTDELERSQEIDLLRAEQAGLPLGESHPDEPLACFPLKIEWEMLHPADREPFPAPERRSEPIPRIETPKSAQQLAQFAREHSWDVRARYARGNFPHASTGRAGALKESVALRFGAHPMTDRQAYAVYSRTAGRGTWSWSSLMIWGPDLTPYGGCGIADLKLYLSEPTAPPDGLKLWVDILKAEQAGTEEARKRRARIRAQILKVSSEGRFEAARQESRLEWDRKDQAWKGKVKDLADGVFTPEELIKIITPKVDQGGMR